MEAAGIVVLVLVFAMCLHSSTTGKLEKKEEIVVKYVDVKLFTESLLYIMKSCCSNMLFT